MHEKSNGKDNNNNNINNNNFKPEINNNNNNKSGLTQKMALLGENSGMFVLFVICAKITNYTKRKENEEEKVVHRRIGVKKAEDLLTIINRGPKEGILSKL